MLATDRRTAALYAGAGCAITLLHAALSATTVGHFSPDSWSTVELSKSVFSGFYRVATVRQFSFEAPYGSSLPPLQPVLMALWNAAAASGPYAGVWINLIVAALTLPALLALGRRLAGSDGPGIFATAALFGSPWYLDSVMGGRATPIAFLLFVVVLQLLHRVLTLERRPERTAAAAGVAAGLIVLARFDFFLPALAIAAALAAGKTREGTRPTAAYVAGFVGAIAPWVVFSLVRVGVPFAADGLRTATTVALVPPMRFVPFPETIATLRNAPFEWIAFRLHHVWPVLEALALAVGASPLPALAAMWAATRTRAQGLPRATTIVLVLAWIALSVQFGVTVVTGDSNTASAIAICTFGTFTIAAALCNGSEIPHLRAAVFILFVPAQVTLMAAAGHEPDRLAGILSVLWPMALVAFVLVEAPVQASRALARAGKAAAVAVPLLALGVGSLLASSVTGSRYRLSADATVRTRSAAARLVEGLEGADPARVRILLAPVAGAPMPGEFGARTGIANVLKPVPPFGWVDLWLLVRRYGITHAVTGDPDIDARLPELFTVHRSANGALWAIDGPRPGLVVVDEGHPREPVPALNTLMVVTNSGGPVEAERAPSRTPDEWPYPLLLVPRK